MSVVKNVVEYTVSLRDLLSAKLKTATQDTNKLNKAVTNVKSTLSGLGGALGVGVGIAGVVGFGKAVIDSLKNYEYFSASLRTLMHGDAQTAKALETQLISLAAKTPFSLVEVQDATKQLLAYGFAAGTVTQNISMLGDVASALKIPFSDIAYLYGTLKTQGRAYTRDIMQFTSRGIPIIHELAKQFGVADSAIKDMVEDGKVGFPEVEKAFQSMTASGGMFYDMMNQQNQTVGGRISALGDSWEQLKVNIGQSQTGIIASTVSFLNESTSLLSNWFKNSNQMSADFAKNGVEDFVFWEKALHHTIGALSAYKLGYGAIVDQEDYQKQLREKYVDTPAKILQESYTQQAELYHKLAILDQRYTNGSMDKDEFLRKHATLKGVISAVNAQQKLLKEKGGVDANGNPINAPTTKASIEPIKASAPKATTINISYGSLNLNQDIKVSNGGIDFKNKVGDNTAEALLNALNDVNRIAATQ
jgi:Tape measure protein